MNRKKGTIQRTYELDAITLTMVKLKPYTEYCRFLVANTKAQK